MEGTHTLTAENIPDLSFQSAFIHEVDFGGTYLALEVIIASKEQTARDREGNGGDTADRFGNLSAKSINREHKREA